MTLSDTILAAASAMRILAVIQHRGNMTWFFKMTGSAGLVEQQKPAFVAHEKDVFMNFVKMARYSNVP